MSLNHGVILTILLIGAMSLAGCMGSSPVLVATPAPLPVATTVPATPVPAGTTPPVVTTTLVTTVQGSPGTPQYSQTHTFDGTGDSTETFTTASDRTWVFRMSSPAKEIFLVTIKNKNGDAIDVLADASDVYAGTESVSLKAGTYYLDIAADAPWTITMSTE